MTTFLFLETKFEKNLHLCQTMGFITSLIFLSTWTTVAFTFPRNPFDNIVKGTRVEFESSGSGPDEPLQGRVKVVQVDPHALTQSALFRRGLSPRRVPSLSSRLPFPSFLSQGRPGVRSKAAMSPLHHLHPKMPTETEIKKRQGLQMWQRAIDKGDKTSLPVNLKDTKQTCSAVPFTQVRGKDFYNCHTLIFCQIDSVHTWKNINRHIKEPKAILEWDFFFTGN